MTLLRSLIDSEDYTWKDMGYCIVPPTEHAKIIQKRADQWFEGYEDDVTIAMQVDEVCAVCPVIQQCLRDGISNKETGVWGGVYLENGKISRTQNSHKTAAVWKELEKRHGKQLHRPGQTNSQQTGPG